MTGLGLESLFMISVHGPLSMWQQGSQLRYKYCPSFWFMCRTGDALHTPCRLILRFMANCIALRP